MKVESSKLFKESTENHFLGWLTFYRNRLGCVEFYRHIKNWNFNIVCISKPTSLRSFWIEWFSRVLLGAVKPQKIERFSAGMILLCWRNRVIICDRHLKEKGKKSSSKIDYSSLLAVAPGLNWPNEKCVCFSAETIFLRSSKCHYNHQNSTKWPSRIVKKIIDE